MTTATASPRLRPIQNPLKGGTNKPPVRIPTLDDDGFPVSQPVDEFSAPQAAPAEIRREEYAGNASALLGRVRRNAAQDLAALFRKGDVLGWGIVTLLGIGILASGITGVIPYWGVAVGLVAFLATGGFVKDIVSAAFVATVRRKAILLLCIMFGVGASLLGAIGTVGWAYAISGISFLTFTMVLHHVHQEKLTVRVTMQDPDDDPDRR